MCNCLYAKISLSVSRTRTVRVWPEEYRFYKPAIVNVWGATVSKLRLYVRIRKFFRNAEFVKNGASIDISYNDTFMLLNLKKKECFAYPAFEPYNEFGEICNCNSTSHSRSFEAHPTANNHILIPALARLTKFFSTNKFRRKGKNYLIECSQNSSSIQRQKKMIFFGSEV